MLVSGAHWPGWQLAGGRGARGGLGVCQRSCMAMAVGGTSQAQIRLMDFYF